MSGTDVLLVALGAITLGGALGTVSARAVVRAGLWLVVALAGLAGCFLVLRAEFVAWVQILIYVGGVVVLLLFASMMTRAPVSGGELDRPRGPGVLVALGAIAGLSTLLVQAFGWSKVNQDDKDVGTAERVGDALFRDWVLGFELLSLLLLAALVGAIVLSRAPAAKKDDA
ncbi:MAG: NADH-quinone oxidoreductase subunit J [Corynebacteriales bacterium]|nr:NADH-quinone oxidoreductase subunit J [Mycobacteriales bacterium]